MKPILTHVHVFYSFVWPELKECLHNMAPHPFELYVTIVGQQPEVEADVIASFPEARIITVENRGYDIAPFLHVLGQVNLDDYSYIVKLHTKRADSPLPFRELSGREWRDSLLAFVSSPERFNSHLAAFEADPTIGLQADYHLHVRRDVYDNRAVRMLHDWLAAHDLPRIPFCYIGGSMFIVRASLLKPLQEYEWKLSDFPDKNTHEASLAHVVERLLGYFVCKQGYTVTDRLEIEIAERYQRRLRIKYFFSPILRFFFQSKKTAAGRRIIKILKVPVYVSSPKAEK